MNGLKLLVNRWFSHRVFLIASLVFFIGMMTTVMIFHENPGDYENEDGDYLMCKLCALLPMVIAILATGIITANQIVGNRFMRAIPAAEKMFTVGVPIFGLLISLGWGLLSNLTYALYILISGGDICNISDMLIITAPFALFCTIIPAVMFSSRIGAVLGMFMYFPFLFIMWEISCMPKIIRYEGFGLPVWAAALISIAAYIVGFAVGLVICVCCYRKGNFRELDQAGYYRK